MNAHVLRRNACANCRRPISLVADIGWLHVELPQYAREPIGCSIAAPVDDEDYRPAPKTGDTP